MTTAMEIACKWVAILGMGFHPDTRGADYEPALSSAQIADYDNDMDILFSLEGDPYEAGLTAMREAFPAAFPEGE